MEIGKTYTKDTIQGKQTWMDIKIYNGKTYPVRMVNGNAGEELLIGNDELLDTIHPGEWEDENSGFDPANPKAAEAVYDEMFFFTDDTTFNYNDEDLLDDMAMENPDFF